MDDENASLEKVILALKEKFGKSIAPLQVPHRVDGKFLGFVNAIKKEGRKYVNGRTEDCEVPDDLKDDVDRVHEMIVEAVAETSDEFMEKFFNEEKFSIEEIQQGVKQGLLDATLTPVICGSATLNIGIRVLLNSLITFVPSCEKFCPSVTVKDIKSGENKVLECKNEEPISAFVYKTIADPYVGRLNLFRVYSGIVKKDSVVYNARTEMTEKIGQLYIMRGKEQIPVSEIRTGDIGAVAKMSNIATGDSLSNKDNPIKFNPIIFKPSYLTYAIYPKGKGEEDKLASAFSKLLEEDKTISFKINKETKESVVTGTGDNQIDILISKLKNKYKLDVELKEPKVPYREMIKSKAKVQNKYKKQSGGHGQYGEVYIEFEPGDLSEPYIFEEKIVGGVVPKQYFPAVEKGIAECVKEGPLAGYPVVGIKCTLVDGSYHPVDSSEMAFKMATIHAFKDGFMKAKPTILEPVQKLKICVPEEYTGDIIGDLNKKRGRIYGMEKEADMQVIQGEAPLSELFKYTTELRSITQGRGYFEMEFLRYDEVPKEIQDKVIQDSNK